MTYDADDSASVIALKKGIISSLLTSLPEPVADLHERLQIQQAAADSPTGADSPTAADSPTGGSRITWHADEADHTGYVRPLYTAEEAVVSSSRVGSRSRHMLRVHRDVSNAQYYRRGSQSGGVGSSPGMAYGLGAFRSSPAGGSEDGRDFLSVLSTSELTLEVAGRRPSSNDAQQPQRSGFSLLGHLLSVKQSGVTSSGDRQESDGTLPGGQQQPMMPLPVVTQRVEATLTLVSSQPALFVCKASFVANLTASGAAPDWCSKVIDEEDDSVAFDYRLIDGDASGWFGPHQATTTIEHPTSGYGRRLLTSPSGRLFVKEPLVVDAVQLAAIARNRQASAAASSSANGEQTASPASRGFGRSLQELAASGRPSYDGHTAYGPSPLGLVFEVLRCFPPQMHDDAVPRPSLMEVNLLGCIEMANNISAAQPNTLVAIQALLLADPCAATSLPSADAADVAAWLAGGSRLWPSPCTNAADADAENPYAEAQLSDRMAALLTSSVSASHHTEAAHAILAHMLSFPQQYRYPTVLEHALQAAVFVQYPSETLLRALLSLIQGLESLDSSQPSGAAVGTAAAAPGSAVGLLLHENTLKSNAVLTLAGLLKRARGIVFAAQDDGSSSGGTGSSAGFLSGDAVRSLESALVGYLYGQYGKVSVVREARRTQEEIVGEIVVSLWHVVPDDQKLRWRAIAHNIRLRDAEMIWATSELSLSDRVAWDAEAMAAWRDQIIEDSAGNPAVLANLRLDIVNELSRALDIFSSGGNTATGASPIGSGRRMLTQVEGQPGLHLNSSAHSHARRLAIATDTATAFYDVGSYEASDATTAVILRAFGNLGSAEHSPLIMNFTTHTDAVVRHSAIEALRSLPADHPVPLSTSTTGSVGGGRRLQTGGGASVKPRVLFAGIEAYVPPSVQTYVESSITELADSHATYGVTQVFGLQAAATDVEAHLLSIIQSPDVPLDTKETAVNVLAQLRPLSASTIDSLLRYYEQHLTHIDGAYDRDACAARCLTDKPKCRVLPIPRCKAECEVDCEWQHKLALSIARFIDQRIRKEAQSARRLASSAIVDPSEHASHPRLAAAARRLEDSLHPSFLPRDSVIDPAFFRPRVLHPSEVTSGAMQGRRLSALTSPGRRLAFRTDNGLPPTHALYRARKLGVLTLVDINIGKVRDCFAYICFDGPLGPQFVDDVYA